jgi:hypothetical protein
LSNQESATALSSGQLAAFAPADVHTETTANNRYLKSFFDTLDNDVTYSCI